jgi:aldehyde dehydrogenase (NAD+)
MTDYRKFYIDGQWVDPVKENDFAVLNPATEEAFATISLGAAADVDKAVEAAQKALKSYSQTTKEERLELIRRIQKEYEARSSTMAGLLSQELGAPGWLAEAGQVAMGWAHFPETLKSLEELELTRKLERTTLLKTPVGVCGLITPWNWPLNQILCKVLPALAAGCTMILKPSEIAPLNAFMLAEIMEAAEVPAGVFNLVNGDGAGVGSSLSGHPGVDMMSFTGSTRAGVLVAKNAADTVKRVTQELGGKSVNIILDDTDFENVVRHGVNSVMLNSGQTCAAPTRMLVPEHLHERACEIAAEVAKETPIVDTARETQAVDTKEKPPEMVDVGKILHSNVPIGPVVSAAQYEKIQGLIAKGISEGAALVAGGLGKPEGFETGYYVKPTVFGNVSNDMTIAREEIFGPVISILPFRDVDHAIEISNDSPFGLSGYVSAGDQETAKAVAARIETGAIHINRSAPDFSAPFGGIKQSGNGREWGEFGIEEFLELKALIE